MDIRWKQRFNNFEKSFLFLQKIINEPELNEIERIGLIKSFEITFELAWKTLKDYLFENGINVKFPREVIKESFQKEIIDDGEIWLEMLEKRNLLSHTYEEDEAKVAQELIVNNYFPFVKILYNKLKSLT